MKCLLQKTSGWCGYCYAARRGREGHPGTRRRESQPPELTEMEFIMAMTREKSNAREKGGTRSTDEVLKQFFPELHDFLTEVDWDDGKKRVTGTVMMLCEDGYWKAWVHDRDAKVSAWLTGESWEGVLISLNKALGEGSLQWRADRR